jgi:pilus assembly protein CpaE
MAQLLTLVVSHDEQFRKQAERLLRSCPVPIGVLDEGSQRGATTPDVVLVDIRNDSTAGMASLERVRGAAPQAAVFALANATEPELILQAMRAGATEFFTWPADPETFYGAIQRTSARREAAHGARPTVTTLAFFGAKGGAGTTTIAVNCAVELARLTKRATVILDLKRGLGEVALFLGIRPRFSLVDAIDNLHRLDRAFLRELVTKHKSSVDLIAGSEQFDRPGAGDASAIEELFQVLTRHYEYIVIDAGSDINVCTQAGLYAAETMFLIANPDVASVRNAQRLIERVRQLGVAGERVRLLLNRAAEPYPIPPNRSKPPSAIRSTTRLPATTASCPRRSTRAFRWRSAAIPSWRSSSIASRAPSSSPPKRRPPPRRPRHATASGSGACQFLVSRL